MMHKSCHSNIANKLFCSLICNIGQIQQKIFKVELPQYSKIPTSIHSNRHITQPYWAYKVNKEYLDE